MSAHSVLMVTDFGITNSRMYRFSKQYQVNKHKERGLLPFEQVFLAIPKAMLTAARPDHRIPDWLG